MNVHSENEANLVDWKGDIIEAKYRAKIILQEDENDDNKMNIGAMIGDLESQTINKLINQSDIFRVVKIMAQHLEIPSDCNQIFSVLNEVNLVLNDYTLFKRMRIRADVGMFEMAIGSTTAHDGETLLNKKEMVKDHWNIFDHGINEDGTHKVRKWVRHHGKPRRTLFVPTETKNGPHLPFVQNTRTTHILNNYGTVRVEVDSSYHINGWD